MLYLGENGIVIQPHKKSFSLSNRKMPD